MCNTSWVLTESTAAVPVRAQTLRYNNNGRDSRGRVSSWATTKGGDSRGGLSPCATINGGDSRGGVSPCVGYYALADYLYVFMLIRSIARRLAQIAPHVCASAVLPTHTFYRTPWSRPFCNLHEGTIQTHNVPTPCMPTTKTVRLTRRVAVLRYNKRRRLHRRDVVLRYRTSSLAIIYGGESRGGVSIKGECS